MVQCIEACSAEEFKAKLPNLKESQIIDVREPFEYVGEHIPKTSNQPLSKIDRWKASLDCSQEPLYFVCQTGARAKQAAEQICSSEANPCSVMEGGLDAWREAGGETVKSEKAVWSMERQVRFAAGLLVVSGVLGALWIHKLFILLSLFVGGGLMFAAVTNTCGMAMLLAKMPWNKTHITR